MPRLLFSPSKPILSPTPTCSILISPMMFIPAVMREDGTVDSQGFPQREIWRSVCMRLCQDPQVNKYERALFASLWSVGRKGRVGSIAL